MISFAQLKIFCSSIKKLITCYEYKFNFTLVNYMYRNMSALYSSSSFTEVVYKSKLYNGKLISKW